MRHPPKPVAERRLLPPRQAREAVFQRQFQQQQPRFNQVVSQVQKQQPDSLISPDATIPTWTTSAATPKPVAERRLLPPHQAREAVFQRQFQQQQYRFNQVVSQVQKQQPDSLISPDATIPTWTTSAATPKPVAERRLLPPHQAREAVFQRQFQQQQYRFNQVVSQVQMPQFAQAVPGAQRHQDHFGVEYQSPQKEYGSLIPPDATIPTWTTSAATPKPVAERRLPPPHLAGEAVFQRQFQQQSYPYIQRMQPQFARAVPGAQRHKDHVGVEYRSPQKEYGSLIPPDATIPTWNLFNVSDYATFGYREHLPAYPPLACLYSSSGDWNPEDSNAGGTLKLLEETGDRLEESPLGNRLNSFMKNFTQLLDQFIINPGRQEPSDEDRTEQAKMVMGDFMKSSAELRGEFIRIGAQFRLENPNERIRELEEQDQERREAIEEVSTALDALLKKSEADDSLFYGG